MRKPTFSLLLVLVIGLLSFGAVAAQDATATPAGDNVEVITTLEDLTANSDSYVGQEVTLEGVIEELLNVRTFVLGEGAALDNDQVLVINNTGQEFDLNVTRDQQVRLTGTVYPSIENGGVGQFANMNNANQVTEPLEPADTITETPMVGDDAAMTEEPMDNTMLTEEAIDDAMMTEEAMQSTDLTPTPMIDTTSPDMGMNDGHVYTGDFTTMVLPEEFNNFTIIVLTSLDTITYIEVQ